MNAARVRGFRPSVHGLHFQNAWPPGPTLRFGSVDLRRLGIGDASQGLCGGMCFVVGDLWAAGVLPPDDRQPPPFDSPRFLRIVHRQVESLDAFRLPAALWLRAIRPDDSPPQRAGAAEAGPPAPPESPLAAILRRLGVAPLGRWTLERDWPRVRRTIDAGRLAMLSLVRQRSPNPWVLATNHQVVAYGYVATAEEIRIAVYDPNHPDRDDVELVIEIAPDGQTVHLRQTTGEPLRGFVLTRYRPEPPGSWRP